MGVREKHEPGLADRFTSEAVAWSPIRRQVFHRSSRQHGLLPSHLPSPYSERKKLPLFPECRRRRRKRVFAHVCVDVPNVPLEPLHGWEPRIPFRGLSVWSARADWKTAESKF